MQTLKLNETPVRTAKNFNINNIIIKDINIDEVKPFNNVEIKANNKVNIKESIENDYNLNYGLGEVLTKQVKENANQKISFTIESKQDKDTEVIFKLDDKNPILVDDIEIIAKEGSKGTIIIKYETKGNIEGFHNGIIRVVASKNADINIIIVNLLNDKSNHFISIDNKLEENAKLNYCMVDFGGKNSIINYYSNLIGNEAQNKINTIYLGKENQVLDINYIGELRGKKSDIEIEVQGALKDKAKKHFKGTIDFKKGCKGSSGNENEACMLLSDTAKSIALPMLLCSEEEVEGNHSSSAGKIGEKELFYIMSRGFELKEAMKLMVRARFNKILENIKNESLKEEILEEINRRLD